MSKSLYLSAFAAAFMTFGAVALAQTPPATTPAQTAPTAAPAAPAADAPAATPAAPAADAPAASAPVGDAGPAGIQPPTSTVSVDNPYGPQALWKNGDFVARGTLVILVIMSFSTWYVMLTKLYEQTRLFSQA
ncbi:MAG TPA: MotA/TolQ/ExbB proton channel family protein, partial [Aliidongia sp.]|nr:MotA/TolQ/ExbB proton channel family protein [Aliidongia sp.]